MWCWWIFHECLSKNPQGCFWTRLCLPGDPWGSGEFLLASSRQTWIHSLGMWMNGFLCTPSHKKKPNFLFEKFFMNLSKCDVKAPTHTDTQRHCRVLQKGGYKQWGKFEAALVSESLLLFSFSMFNRSNIPWSWPGALSTVWASAPV